MKAKFCWNWKNYTVGFCWCSFKDLKIWYGALHILCFMVVFEDTKGNELINVMVDDALSDT